MVARALTHAQQTIIRSLMAERSRTIAAHNAAIAEYVLLLKRHLRLKGDWTFGGNMAEIKLVCQDEEPEEPDG